MLFKLLTILSVSFVATNLQTRHLISILSLNDNLFYNTNEKLHSSINNLFYSLKMSHNFTKGNKNQILLQMHNDCNDVAEKIYNIYEKIRKRSKVHVDTKTSINVDRLCKLVGEILQENPTITITNDTEPKNQVNHDNYSKLKSVRRLDDKSYELKNITALYYEPKMVITPDKAPKTETKSVINNNYTTIATQTNYNKSELKNGIKLTGEPKLDAKNNKTESDIQFDNSINYPKLATKTNYINNEVNKEIKLAGEQKLDAKSNGLEREIKFDNNDASIHSNNDFTDDDEPLDFVKDFLTKINKLTKEDLIKSPMNENDIDIYKQMSPNIENEPRTTKTWHPWISSEEPDDFTANRRIYKGKSTRIKKYSFVASIHVSNEFVCAGSIISEDLIITAASCLHIVYTNKEYYNKITVRVGSDYSSFFGVKRQIKEVIFHPKYNPVNLHSNLAILRTNPKIHFSSKKKKIRKIEYDREAGELSENAEYVTLLGWGAKSERSEFTNYHKLSFAKLDVYNMDGCSEIYTRYYVSDSNFCAGFVTKGGGACNRDAGGPGVVRGLLTGVVSFGSPECGAADAPTVFTKLGYFANWIDDVVNREPVEHDNCTLRNLPTLEKNIPTTQIQKNEERNMVTPNVLQEILILREILLEMAQQNNSVNDLLYDELEEDFNETMYKTTEQVDIFHHPLLNKSLFIYADVEDLTTQSTVKPDNSWVHLMTPSTTVFTTDLLLDYMKPGTMYQIPITEDTRQTNPSKIQEIIMKDTEIVRVGNMQPKIPAEKLSKTTQMVKYDIRDEFEFIDDRTELDSMSTYSNKMPKHESEPNRNSDSRDPFLNPFLKKYVKYFSTKHRTTTPFLRHFKSTETKLI